MLVCSLLLYTLGALAFVPFHGLFYAPLYAILTVIKTLILILLNPKLEEVQLCILEQHLQNTSHPKRGLVTMNFSN